MLSHPFCYFIGSKILNVMPWISQSSEIKSEITESFWGNRWWIHLDGLSNFLHSIWKKPAASFFKNNYCFPEQGNVGHHTKKVTEKGLGLFIKHLFKVHFMRIIAAAKASLVDYILSCCLFVVHWTWYMYQGNYKTTFYFFFKYNDV